MKGAIDKAKAIAARAKRSIKGVHNVYTQHKPVIHQVSTSIASVNGVTVNFSFFFFFVPLVRFVIATTVCPNEVA